MKNTQRTLKQTNQIVTVELASLFLEWKNVFILNFTVIIRIKARKINSNVIQSECIKINNLVCLLRERKIQINGKKRERHNRRVCSMQSLHAS